MSSQQMNQNQTTYEMKDSGIEWMGHIPSNWEVVKLNSKYKFHTGFTPDTKKPEFYDDNGFNWVTISDLNKSKIISDTQKRISELGVSMTKGLLTPKGSLLYSFKLSVGQVGIAGEDLYTNEAIASFVPQKNECLNFLYYSSQVCIIKNAIENIYGAKLLNQELIKSAKIVVPPLHEQQAIATYLDEQVEKIDGLISAQKQAIENWKAYKQSLITETVTKGLNPNVEMKDSGIEWIGDIPNDWEVKKAKYLIKFRTGLSITKNDFVDIGCKTINYGQIHSKYTFDLDLTRDELFKVNIEYAESNPLTILKEGDFAFCDTSEDLDGCGNCVLVENTNGELLLAGSHTTIGRAKYPYISRYMAYLFKSENFRVQIRSSVSGIKVFSITQKILNNTYLIIPSLQEQQAIADYLDEKCLKIDEAIEQKQTLIKQLEEYKQSLIYECVTGKRWVR